MVGHTYLTQCELLGTIACSELAALNTSDNRDSVNIECGEPSDRSMTTGLHTVRDIQCVKCGIILGWKYVSYISPLPPLLSYESVV